MVPVRVPWCDAGMPVLDRGFSPVYDHAEPDVHVREPVCLNEMERAPEP